MKKLLTLATMVALLLGLASCSSGGDARELLGNVPEKAQAVVVLNIDKMISDADLQTDGDKVELSRQLKQLTADADVNPLDLLSKGAIRHTAAVFFAVDNEPFLTGFIADEKAFVRFFEDAWEDSFGTESGMQVLSKGNNAIAIVDDRFWLTTPAGLDNVRKYMDLDTDRSFAGTGLADELSSADRDIAGCVNISDMLELAQASGSSPPCSTRPSTPPSTAASRRARSWPRPSCMTRSSSASPTMAPTSPRSTRVRWTA